MLLALLAKICSISEPTVVVIYLLYLVEALHHFYLVAHRSEWHEYFHFQVRVRDFQGLFAWWQKFERFSMRNCKT